MANYLDKSNIERQPLKNNFLKRVIIRFDFTSIVNMQSVLDNIVAYLQSLKESFGSFDQMTAPQEEIEKYGGLGNGDNKEDRPFIYRFSDCQIEPKQDVTLDFARNYLCMDIRCNGQYYLIDSYLNIMKALASIIIDSDRFVRLERIGIRKIDGIDAIDPSDANNVFEYFSQKLAWGDSDRMKARQYTDYMICDDLPAYVNYSRIVRVIPGENKLLRFTLDIDCYKDSKILEKRPDNNTIATYLDSMNKKLFDLFIMGIKLEYLNQNL